MSYIEEMRRKIGTMPIVACAGGCLIFDKQGRVLLQRRRDDGLWGNIGGIVELGETVEEAVVREIREETGLVVKKTDLRFFGIYSGEQQHYVYSNGDEMYFVNVLFEVNEYCGEVRKDEESLELEWFAIDNLPSEITGPFGQVREELLRRGDR